MADAPEKRSSEDPDLKKNWYEHGSAMWLFALGAILIWSLGIIPYAYGALNSSATLYPSPGGAGVFGDSFGAINALLSALGVAFVALALLKQQAELQHTRRELRETLKANQEMAESQGRLAKEQERAVAIEALRIHCDSLEAHLSAYTAICNTNPAKNDPDVLEQASAAKLVAVYSTELAFAASALTRSRDEPSELLRKVGALVRRSLLNSMRAIGEVAEVLDERKSISGLYFLETQFDSTVTAMECAGFPGVLDNHLNTQSLPRPERMQVIAERASGIVFDYEDEDFVESWML